MGSNPTLSATQSSRTGVPCETHILQAETASFHTDSRLILTAETRCVADSTMFAARALITMGACQKHLSFSRRGREILESSGPKSRK